MSRVSRLVRIFACSLILSTASSQTENKNLHLRIGSIESEPFLRLVEGEGNDGYEGFIKDLLEEISSVQGFTYELVLSVDNKYGVNSGGNWSGLVGMVQREEIDLIAADLTVTWSRMSTIDFSKPFLASSLTLLLKDPSQYSVAMSAWFDPFSWDVWILLIISYFVSSLVLCLVARLSPIENTSIAARLSLKDSFWYLISCWFRASDFKPKAWSARLLSCCWWMFYITVIIIYFLHLPPHLATPTTASRPTTVQSVLDKDVTFGVVQGGSTLQLLKSSFNPLHQSLWNSISSDYSTSIIESYNAGMQRVNNENGSFSIVMESNAADYLTAQDCSLYTVGSLEDRHYAFGFPKGSRHRRMFSQGLLEMTETGKLSAAKFKWWPEPTNCPQPTVSIADEKSTLTLDHLAPPLLFLLVAIILSLLVSFLELVTSKDVSSLPKYLNKMFSNTPTSNSSFQKFCPSVATQTVLWASSRATTPAPGSPTSNSQTPLYHRIYTHDGKLAKV